MTQFLHMKEVPGYNAQMVVVTPADAAEMLKRNTHNRKVRLSVVAKYVNEINAGEWRPVPAGVGFDEDGVLIDGQHRLSAIVESGIAAPLLIVTGFPRASQEKCDRHTRRSLYDVMALAGYENSKSTVQACTFLAKVRNGIRDMMASVADVDVKDMLNRYGASADAMVCKHGGQKTATTMLLSRAGSLAAFAMWHRNEPASAIAFRGHLVDAAAPSRNHPAAVLMRAITSEAWHGGYVGGGVGQIIDFTKTMTAIVAAREGREIQLIKAYTGKLPWAI